MPHAVSSYTHSDWRNENASLRDIYQPRHAARVSAWRLFCQNARTIRILFTTTSLVAGGGAIFGALGMIPERSMGSLATIALGLALLTFVVTRFSNDCEN